MPPNEIAPWGYQTHEPRPALKPGGNNRSTTNHCSRTRIFWGAVYLPAPPPQESKRDFYQGDHQTSTLPNNRAADHETS